MACRLSAQANLQNGWCTPNRTQDIKEIQKALSDIGHYNGAIDGKIGPQTKKAIAKFQDQKDIEVNGKYSPEIKSMLSAQSRKKSDTQVTEDILDPKLSTREEKRTTLATSNQKRFFRDSNVFDISGLIGLAIAAILYAFPLAFFTMVVTRWLSPMWPNFKNAYLVTLSVFFVYLVVPLLVTAFALSAFSATASYQAILVTSTLASIPINFIAAGFIYGNGLRDEAGKYPGTMTGFKIAGVLFLGSLLLFLMLIIAAG